MLNNGRYKYHHNSTKKDKVSKVFMLSIELRNDSADIVLSIEMNGIMKLLLYTKLFIEANVHHKLEMKYRKNNLILEQ
jgi:hypothetical protein